MPKLFPNLMVGQTAKRPGAASVGIHRPGTAGSSLATSIRNSKGWGK